MREPHGAAAIETAMAWHLEAVDRAVGARHGRPADDGSRMVLYKKVL